MSDTTTKLFSKIFNKGGETFYLLSNPEKKKWLMPIQDMDTALNLYQPSSPKGKMVKYFLPYFQGISILRQILGITPQKYELTNDIKFLLQGLFQMDDIQFSVFYGTPSIHQKIIIQIYSGEHILGYCKVTDIDEIKAIFKHEESVLAVLKNKGVNQIPRCIYRETIMGNIDLFVQTTGKTKKSKTIHILGKIHWIFLTELYLKTQQTLPFEQTDFFKILSDFSHYIDKLTGNEAGITQASIDYIISNFKNSEVTFSIFHADFTPWNTFMEKNGLFVFDWEYAQYTCPPFMDAFHFITQTGIFEKKWSAKKIFNHYLAIKPVFSSLIKNPNLIYECYLIYIIAQYSLRDKFKFKDSTVRMMKTWVQLLVCLRKNDKT